MMCPCKMRKFEHRDVEREDDVKTQGKIANYKPVERPQKKPSC